MRIIVRTIKLLYEKYRSDIVRRSIRLSICGRKLLFRHSDELFDIEHMTDSKEDQTCKFSSRRPSVCV